MVLFEKYIGIAARPKAVRVFLKCKTGTAAVEFAIIAPLFLMMVLGMLGFGIYLGAAHSTRQLTSDVARATIAGTTEIERQTIAHNFVFQSLKSYAFLDLEHIDVIVSDSESAPNQFDVQISFRADDLPVWSLMDFVPQPGKVITATATIKNGGFAQ